MHPSFNPTNPPTSPFSLHSMFFPPSLFPFQFLLRGPTKNPNTPLRPPHPLPSGTSPTDQWSSWHCQWQRQQSCQFHTSSCFRYPATMGKSPVRAPWVPTIFFSECPFQKRAGLARRRPGAAAQLIRRAEEPGGNHRWTRPGDNLR